MTTKVLTPHSVNGLIPTPVGQINRSRRINMLLYGDPGDGKTRLAGSSDEVADFRKVLHLDVEGGSLTLDALYPRVESVRIDDWEQLWDFYLFLRDEEHEYQTVIIDNLTEAQKLAQRGVMADAKERAKNPDDIEPEVPRQRDYLVLYERLTLMVRAFRDLPLHCIMTAHVKEEIDNRSMTRKLKPSLSGQAKQDIPGFFDIVGYLHVVEVGGENVRVLTTGSAPGHVAKQRGTTLPENLDKPTMEKIYSHVPKGD